MAATADGTIIATAVQPRYISGRTRMASIAIFTSLASIFLPTYSGVRPTIRPATKIEMMTNSSMPYMPEPTPPTMISPSWMLISGTMPPIAVNESCMALTARRIRGDHGKQRRGGDAEPDFLALEIAAGQPERGQGVVAMRLGPVANDRAGEEQHTHDRKHGPALPRVTDHAAEHIGQRRAEREDRDDLHIVRQRGRVFKRMRRIGVEEAAAIGAEHFDGNLRGDRAERDGLLGAFQSRGVDIGAERLRNALPDQEQRVGHADREQDVKRAAGDVDPEVADGFE